MTSIEPCVCPFSSMHQVDVILDTHFLLENGRATSIQLEVDARRSTGADGGVFFRGWADGDVVYEARVSARDARDAAGEEMLVEDVLLHVLAVQRDEEEGGANQSVLVGGVEVCGQCDREGPVSSRGTGTGASRAGGVVADRIGRSFGGAGYVNETNPGLPGIVCTGIPETKLRFVFVAR